MSVKRPLLPAAVAVLVLPWIACKSPSTTPAPAAPSPQTAAETAPAPAPPPPAPADAAAASAADHIKVQHILISFVGKVPGKNITRSQEEARTLAMEILDRAKKGEDFDSLVKTYTDDRAPGIYGLANSGVTPAADEFSRDRMVPAFGEVGFSLAPGEIGIAEYDPARSPFGWHVIKRLE